MSFTPASRFAFFLLLWSSLLCAAPVPDVEVKAAFLLNFARFVQWPSSAFAAADSPMAICILGRDPFGRVLDEIVQGESVNGRRVTVERLTEVPGPHACQLVYLASGNGNNLQKTLSAIGPAVLTVGEGDDFLRSGGMVAFVIEDRRVRFDIDQTAAENGALKLSSRLLSVARFVEHRPPDRT